MYTIIGGDGQEYGPVSPEQIRQWIAAGRANAGTRAKFFGTEEWKQLGDFADFAPPPPVLTGFHEAIGEPAGHSAAPLGSRLRRLGAVLCDGLISSICCIPLFVSVPFATIATAIEHQDTSSLASLPGMAVGGAITFSALFVLFVVQLSLLTLRGQTVGKLLLGVRIVRHDTGGRASFARVVLLRSVAMTLITWIPYVGFLIALIDYCCIFRDDRRCLHDLLAGTMVVAAEGS